AVMAVSAWADEPRAACVVVKHTTPCGVALATDARKAYEQANAGDPVSAFGGIVAFNRSVDRAAAEAMAGAFLEIGGARAFDEDARTLLQRKKNLRLIGLPSAPADAHELDYKRVRGGFLVQHRMPMRFPEESWKVASTRAPSEEEMRDLRFAWRVAAA